MMDLSSGQDKSDSSFRDFALAVDPVLSIGASCCSCTCCSSSSCSSCSCSSSSIAATSVASTFGSTISEVRVLF